MTRKKLGKLSGTWGRPIKGSRKRRMERQSVSAWRKRFPTLCGVTQPHPVTGYPFRCCRPLDADGCCERHGTYEEWRDQR